MNTPQSNTDVAELRKDALDILFFIILIVGVSLLVIHLLYSEIVPKANLSLVPILVLLGAIVVADGLKRRERIESSAWLLVGGLILSPSLFLTLHGPSQFIYFCFTIPVVAASMIVGGKAEFWISGLIMLIMLSVTLLWETGSDNLLVNFGQALGVIIIPAITNLLIASIVHLNYHNILTMVQWAVDSQQKDAQRSQLLYHQQQQLKQTMLQLERANIQLQLVNAQLSEARKASDIANQHKTQFLANVSHELRSPLNLILGYTQAALEASQLTNAPSHTSHTLKRDLQHIWHNSEQLNRLINDLLDVSRAEMNVLELFSQNVDPASLLEDTFYSVTDQHNPDNSTSSTSPVEWQLHLAPRLPDIQADPVRLRQIIINLLNNAAKFTDYGHIILGAEIALPYLHIWVEDSGTGIPVDQQELIFEPFVSGKTSAGRPNSIGLGLSIVRHLVALHNGLLTVESQVGKGSIFHVYLPLPVLETQAGWLPNESGALNFKHSKLEPVLLLLSLSSQIAPEIVELSERQNLSIVRVNQNTDWPELLTRVKPAGLVWDLHEANSPEPYLLQQLRSYPQLSRIPTVFYRQSAVLNGSDEIEAELELGLTDFVLKPLSSTALINTVHSLQPTSALGPILIVDDDLATCNFYTELLRQAFPDCQVSIAHDGQMAQKIMAEKTPCLILLDLMMPVMDGFTFLECVRADNHTRQTPVLVLSGQVLKIEDIARLNYAHLTFQSKEILSQEEIKTTLQRIVQNKEDKKELNPQSSNLVKKAIVYLQDNYAEALTRRQIAAFVEVNERYLTALFHNELGISPWDYLNRYRIKQAKWLLLNTTDTITLIAGQVGFNDAAYFSRVFNKEVGMSPRLYREKFS